MFLKVLWYCCTEALAYLKQCQSCVHCDKPVVCHAYVYIQLLCHVFLLYSYIVLVSISLLIMHHNLTLTQALFVSIQVVTKVSLYILSFCFSSDNYGEFVCDDSSNCSQMWHWRTDQVANVMIISLVIYLAFCSLELVFLSFVGFLRFFCEDEEKLVLKNEFVEIMQQRFLNGEDMEFDYQWVSVFNIMYKYSNRFSKISFLL